jgi:hypothetical protein
LDVFGQEPHTIAQNATRAKPSRQVTHMSFRPTKLGREFLGRDNLHGCGFLLHWGHGTRPVGEETVRRSRQNGHTNGLEAGPV